METTIKYLLVGGILLFTLNFLHAEGPKWNTDVLIYSGAISCFDVDYTMDGTMYLGFQKDESPTYPVCFYTSTDHGYTWELRYETPSLGRIPKMKILVGEPLYDYLFFFFVSPIDSFPYVWRIASDFSGIGEGFVIDSIIADEAGFDAARAIQDTYSMVSAFCELGLPDHWWYIKCYRSHDYGQTWEKLIYAVLTPSYSSQEFSIAWGPPANYYLAYVHTRMPSYPPDSAEIKILYSLTNGYIWDWTSDITNNSRRDSDPHIAASHDINNPAIWIADTYLDGGVDADLHAYSCPSPDSIESSWHTTTVANTGMSEYWGDIKFYKERGNPYVDMTWIHDDLTNRDVHWTWSGGYDPGTWQDDTVINDHMAHPWPFGAAPRIAYSPGAPIGGGGVVYAGFGGQNLYFDAPWITTEIKETEPPEVSYFSFYPSLLTAKRTINLLLSRDGLVEVSLYDISGRLAYHLGPVFWNEGSHSIPLNQLSSGIYFLQLRLNNSLSEKAKLVILE